MGENVKFSNCNLMIRDSNGEFQELIIDNLGNMSVTFENNKNTENNKTVDLNSEASIMVDGKLEEEILDKLCATDSSGLAYTDLNNTITYDTKYELAPELKEEIDNRVDKEIDKKWKEWWEKLWCELENDIKYTSKNPITAGEIEKTIKNNNKRNDSLTALCYGLEEMEKHLNKCSESLEKFAEKSKLAYNKEKEKKGSDDMTAKELAKGTIAVVRFWDTEKNVLNQKTYRYFFSDKCKQQIFQRGWGDICSEFYRFNITNDLGRVYSNPVSFISIIDPLDFPPHAFDDVTRTITDLDLVFYDKVGEDIKRFKSIKEQLKNRKKEKEKEQMNFNKIFPNAYIGKANDVRMSIYGPAFRIADERSISFKEGEWVDVTGFTFDFAPAFVCPVKATDVAVGDFIKHFTTWCRVISIDNGTITAENVYVHEVITILPVKSMFGFDFYSKLIMPFGNITSNMGDMFSNPFVTMMLFGGESKDFNDMLPFMLMNGGNFDMSNPMMLYFLMKGDKESPKFEVSF